MAITKEIIERAAKRTRLLLLCSAMDFTTRTVPLVDELWNEYVGRRSILVAKWLLDGNVVVHLEPPRKVKVKGISSGRWNSILKKIPPFGG